MINIPLELIIENNNVNMDNTNMKIKRYWPVPPVIQSTISYQDVNKDINLRKDVTLFFHDKVLHWIKDKSKFKDKLLDSIDGKMHIYNLLRRYVKKTGLNWYDLRTNYKNMKKYFLHNL